MKQTKSKSKKKPAPTKQKKQPAAAPVPEGRKAPAMHKAVLLDAACDVTAFCSDDATRVNISGVCVKPEKHWVEATNGQIAIRVPLRSPDASKFPKTDADFGGECSECILPAKELKLALKNTSKHCPQPETDTARLETSKPSDNFPVPAEAKLTTTNLIQENVVTAKPIDGVFPKMDSVLPVGRTHRLTIGLSADLLKILCDYAIKHGKDAYTNGHHHGIKFMFGDELSTVLFEVDLADMGQGSERKAIGAFQPMRTI